MGEGIDESEMEELVPEWGWRRNRGIGLVSDLIRIVSYRIVVHEGSPKGRSETTGVKFEKQLDTFYAGSKRERE